MTPFLRSQLTRALIGHFGLDDRRIEHALEVAKWAERIIDDEGGDRDVVLAVGLLHDVGIIEAEARHGHNTGRMQEEYGPPVVRRILQEIGLEQEKIEEACAIVGKHHTANGVPGPNFAALWDADLIVNLRDEMPDASREKLASVIEKSFRTGTGKELARKALIGPAG